jgi:hypothetical protein
MATISVSLPSDGETIDASDYNTPINTIVNEFNGNIDNNNIKSAAAIDGSKIADASITPNKLDLDVGSATVTTSETTTSTSYTDLTTTTDSVTVTIGSNGLALVSISSNSNNNTINQYSYVSFEMSGANTLSAQDVNSIFFKVNASPTHEAQFGKTKLFTGLNAGSTTFKMKYRVSANTGTFSNRNITVIAL